MPIKFDTTGQFNFDRGYARPTWHYTTSSPQGSWTSSGYHDKGWHTGSGAFGDRTISDHGQVTDVGTTWTSGEIWMRKTFSVDSSPAHPALYLRHDGPIEVYINGKVAYIDDTVHPPLDVSGPTTLTPGVDDYATIPLTDSGPLHIGVDTIAVHCATAAERPAYVDVGVVDQPN